MQEFDVLRVILAFSFFAYASASDWKTRKVRNAVWVILGIASLALFWVEMLISGAPLIAQSLLLPLAFIFADVFWEKEGGWRKPAGLTAIVLYIVSFCWIGYVVYTVAVGETQWTAEISGPLVAFVMVIVFELFYMFDVIKGGADAKAVICLAMLFPSYPQLANSIPIILPNADWVLTLFPFALSVLFMGALAACLVPLYFFARNAKEGRLSGARSFLGFTMPIDEVEKHFVWPLEWVEGGQVRFSYRKIRDSKDTKADLVALREAGRSEIWVTYKIPFIIPLTAGMLFVIVIGNLLFLVY